MTTTTTPAMPLHRNRQGFALDRCHRCGGSGQYSWNAMTGSTCFGCGGTGWKLAAGQTKPYEEYQEAVRRLRRPTTADLQPGDIVTSDFAGILSNAPAKDATWREVVAVTTTDRECGWSTTGVEGTPGYVKTVYYYLAVEFTDGEREVNANQCWIRKGAVDPAPYVERALKGWRKAGCKGGRK